MFHKVMIVLAAVAFVGSTSTPGVHAFGDKNGRAEFGDTHIAGPLRSLVIQTSTVMFPEALEPGLVTSIWVLKVTVASPTRDYGLYTPHFC
jgi:hypothetical protein